MMTFTQLKEALLAGAINNLHWLDTFYKMRLYKNEFEQFSKELEILVKEKKNLHASWILGLIKLLNSAESSNNNTLEQLTPNQLFEMAINNPIGDKQVKSMGHYGRAKWQLSINNKKEALKEYDSAYFEWSGNHWAFVEEVTIRRALKHSELLIMESLNKAINLGNPQAFSIKMQSQLYEANQKELLQLCQTANDGNLEAARLIGILLHNKCGISPNDPYNFCLATVCKFVNDIIKKSNRTPYENLMLAEMFYACKKTEINLLTGFGFENVPKLAYDFYNYYLKFCENPDNDLVFRSIDFDFLVNDKEHIKSGSKKLWQLVSEGYEPAKKQIISYLQGSYSKEKISVLCAAFFEIEPNLDLVKIASFLRTSLVYKDLWDSKDKNRNFSLVFNELFKLSNKCKNLETQYAIKYYYYNASINWGGSERGLNDFLADFRQSLPTIYEKLISNDNELKLEVREKWLSQLGGIKENNATLEKQTQNISNSNNDNQIIDNKISSLPRSQLQTPSAPPKHLMQPTEEIKQISEKTPQVEQDLLSMKEELTQIKLTMKNLMISATTELETLRDKFTQELAEERRKGNELAEELKKEEQKVDKLADDYASLKLNYKNLQREYNLLQHLNATEDGSFEENIKPTFFK